MDSKKTPSKIKTLFFSHPLLLLAAICLFLAFLTALAIICNYAFSALRPLSPQALIPTVFWLIIFLIPVLLSAFNIIMLFVRHSEKAARADRKIEVATIVIGLLFSAAYFSLTEIVFADWNVQLYNNELHSPVFTESILTLAVLAAVVLSGYIYLRFVPSRLQTPLLCVTAMAAVYLGVCLSIVWCVQIFKHTEHFALSVLPINLVLIAFKTVRYTVCEYDAEERGVKKGALASLLSHSASLPTVALLFAIPLLGVVIIILTLFGQQPDAIIRAWTETADWTLSQKISPQNISVDMHYLCTVSAGGHRQIVKPLRTGIRHGHRVVVNRQLCVANAFEQLISERTPRFHKAVRAFYDSFGYPVAKHIRSRFAADAVYILMKPLEYVFLAVLYCFDRKPENRIAVQYPHKRPPDSL